MIVTETKWDSSFPSGQFSINGFLLNRFVEIEKNRSDVMIYVRDDIPLKEIKVNLLPSDEKSILQNWI